MENNIIEQENTQTTNTGEIKAPPPIIKDDKSKKPVGYFAYLGLFILFAIPVIGWIACAIFMFVPKNKSLNNYARAFMTKLLIKLFIVFFIISALGAIFLPVINSELGTDFHTWADILSVAGDMASGNYTSTIRVMKPQLVKALGQEYEPIIDELSKDEYNQLISQIINGEYEQALSDLKADKYPALPGVLGKELYNTFMDELEAEVNGEDTMFDEFREILPSLIEEFGAMGFGGFDSPKNKVQHSSEMVVVTQ